jgi:hypothetical protein
MSRHIAVLFSEGPKFVLLPTDVKREYAMGLNRSWSVQESWLNLILSSAANIVHGKLVNLVMLFLVPQDQFQKHLHTLVNLAELLHKRDFRDGSRGI